MATYTDNYTMTKPTYAEQADISVINANMDIIDNVMHSSQISLAPAYDINETYNTGDIVMHELLMYKCLEDNVTGAWDSTKWTRTTAGEESGSGADLDIYGEANGTAEASFSDGAEASLVECEIGIVPTQDLHGYSKPWAGGSGKNKLSDTWSDYTTYGSYRYIKIANFVSGDYIMSFTDNDTSIDLTGIYIGFMYDYPDQNTQYRWCLSNGVIQSNTTNTSAIDNTTKCDTIIILPNTEETFNKLFQRYHIQVESGTTATTYEPYSNICPISGHTDVTVTVASTSGGSGDDTTVSLGRTVYGGTLDVTTGELTVTHGYIYADGSFNVSNVAYGSGVYYTIVKNSIGAKTNNPLPISDKFKSESVAQAGNCYITYNGNYLITVLPDQTADTIAKATQWFSDNPTQFVYDLATPQTFNLTPTQVETLLGQNYVSHDGGGTISLVYIKKDSTIIPNSSDAEVPLTGLEISGKGFKITDARIPAPPTTNGAYVLTVTVTGGTPTYSWENA